LVTIVFRSPPTTKPETAAHSSRTLLRGGNTNPAVSKNQSRFCESFLPQNSFVKTSPNCICTPPVRISLRTEPRKKNTLSFFKKNSPPPNQKCKECFSFGVAAESARRSGVRMRSPHFCFAEARCLPVLWRASHRGALARGVRLWIFSLIFDKVGSSGIV